MNSYVRVKSLAPKQWGKTIREIKSYGDEKYIALSICLPHFCCQWCSWTFKLLPREELIKMRVGFGAEFKVHILPLGRTWNLLCSKFCIVPLNSFSDPTVSLTICFMQSWVSKLHETESRYRNFQQVIIGVYSPVQRPVLPQEWSPKLLSPKAKQARGCKCFNRRGHIICSAHCHRPKKNKQFYEWMTFKWTNKFHLALFL